MSIISIAVVYFRMQAAQLSAVFSFIVGIMQSNPKSVRPNSLRKAAAISSNCSVIDLREYT